MNEICFATKVDQHGSFATVFIGEHDRVDMILMYAPFGGDGGRA